MEALVIFLFAWAVIGAIVTPIIYRRKSRNPRTGMIVGMITGALGGIILLAPLWIFISRPQKQCPRCAENVKTGALVCSHCGYEFPEPVAVEPSPWFAYLSQFIIHVIAQLIISYFIMTIGIQIFWSILPILPYGIATTVLVFLSNVAICYWILKRLVRYPSKTMFIPPLISAVTFYTQLAILPMGWGLGNPMWYLHAFVSALAITRFWYVQYYNPNISTSGAVQTASS